MPLEVPSADRVTLSRYLLGQLSAAEEDAVEDRFAADDTYFELYEEVERSLIHDYAAGALETVDSALFERNYLVTAERRQRVTIVRALLAAESEEQIAQRMLSLPLPRLAATLVFAALIVAVAVFWVYQQRFDLQQTVAQRQVSEAARPPAKEESPGAAAHATSEPTEVAKEQSKGRSVAGTTKPPRAAYTQEQAPAAAQPPASEEARTGSAPAKAPPTSNEPPTPATPDWTLSKLSGKDPPIDDVVAMVKGGLSESLIIKQLQQQNKAVNLTPSQMVQLKNAGASENIITVMMNPRIDPSSLRSTSAAPSGDPAPVAVASSSAGSAARKRRVAIAPFDYSAVMTQVEAVFGTQQNIGQGIQTMLLRRIAESGKFIVVDRRKLQRIKDEQDMGLGGRNQQGSGARVGRLKGADAILAGDITMFGRDDKNIGGRGGECKAWDLKCRAMGGGVQLNKAVVVITYRLVDAETGEIIATGEARGEKKKTSLGGGGGESSYWGNSKGGGFSMTSSNFAESMVGQATQDCVNKLADILDDQATNMKRTVREVEASVVDVTGNTVMIGAGANDGVSVGEVFEIHHILKEVKAPNSQEVLDRKTEMIGQMTITSVRPKFATGTYSGPPLLATKDYVAIKNRPQ